MRITRKSKPVLSVAEGMDVSTVIVVLTMVMLLIGGATDRGDDWRNYRGPNHDGISAETNWKANWGAAGPKKLWTKSIGVGFSSIVVSNARAYTTGNSVLVVTQSRFVDWVPRPITSYLVLLGVKPRSLLP